MRNRSLHKDNDDTTHTVALVPFTSPLMDGLRLTLRGGGRSVLHRLAAIIRHGGIVSRGSLILSANAGSVWALQRALGRVFFAGDGAVQMVIVFRLPVLHVVFTVVQNLSSLCAVLISAMFLTRDYGTVV